jgi:hypothetical protein
MDEAMTHVHQIPASPEVRALSTLAHVDYADAFLVETPDAQSRTAEQWARAVLEDAPIATRSQLLSGWSSIGLKVRLGPPDRTVLGWRIRRNDPDLLLLGAHSWIGMPGELLFKRGQDAVVFATFVQRRNPIARLVWRRVEGPHVRIVSRILEQALKRIEPAGQPV